MIYGIGIDIIEINKITRIVTNSGDKLARRILSTSEFKIYKNKKYPVRFLAKRFAAKEAVSKAFGTGVRKGIAFNQFEIFNDELGKPILRLFSYAKLLSKELALTNIHLALSDTDYYACAVATLER